MSEQDKKEYTLKTITDEDIESIAEEIDAILNDSKYHTKH
jgi:hypothetical protein